MLRRTLALLLLLATTTTAAYHFVRYSSRFGYQQPIYERFDLNSLINKTVPFFLVSDGQEKLPAGDNSSALMSQILLAARTWSEVPTSELRLAFGGYATAASGPQGAPGIDVMFSEDVPPGVISYAGPTVKADADLNTSEPFTPILRSLVVFRKDLSSVEGVPYASYSEAFFLNAVHELGHALGLQHTFTSSAMSTQLTRATTRSRPLAADDISAISTLYPSRNFAALFASISGRVTQNGTGVNMASVVAISLSGNAVSTLSNPDGTYRIQGIPPGPYQVFVHPIPPPVRGQANPGDIILPRDPQNLPIAVNNRFDLQFFPGTRDPQAAANLNLAAAQNLSDINFSVNTRNSAPTLFYPTTYSFITNTATNSGNYVRPAFITPQVVNPGFIASGFGFVTADSRPVPGLRSSMLGGSPAVNGIRSFSNQFIIFDLFVSGVAGDGARHMVLDNGTETTVLPAAIQVAARRAPEVLNVNWLGNASDGTRLAQVTAANIGRQTRVLVDGEAASIRSIDEATGIIQFAAPAATTGQVARIVLLNQDGQSSLFLRPEAPAQLPYLEPEANSFTISPASLLPASEAVLEINSSGARFQMDRVSVGFGSSDVQVRSISVLSPTRLLVSVVTTPQANANYTVTLQSGLSHLQLRNGVSIQGVAALSRPAFQVDPRWTTETGSPAVMPGSNAVILVGGLNANSRVSATLNDVPAQVLSVGSGRILLQIPGVLSVGLAHLKLNVDGEAAASALVAVSGAAPTIQRFENSDQFTVDAQRPAQPGDTMLVTFIDPSLHADANLRANEVSMAAGETPIFTLRVEKLAAGVFQAAITLPRGIADGTIPFTVSINGRTSTPTALAIRNR
jgi:uncharacterized protein (TIGR03437 family)